MNVMAVVAVSEAAGLPSHIKGAIAIAIVFSLVLAAVEIPSLSKKPLRSCMVPQSVFYCVLLIFGNVVSTLLAAILVLRMNPSLAPYYFIFAAFFGVFAFEVVLKNTNVTVFDKGVLTIQDWITKARNAAAAQAIERDIERMDVERGKLAARLSKIPDTRLNTFVALKIPATGGANIVQQLDSAAQANSADPKLYKAYALVAGVSRSEVLAFLNAEE